METTVMSLIATSYYKDPFWVAVQQLKSSYHNGYL